MGFALRKNRDQGKKETDQHLEFIDGVDSAEAVAAQKILDDLYFEVEKRTSSFVLGGTAKYMMRRVIERFKKDQITPRGRLYIAAELFKKFGGGIEYQFPEPDNGELEKAQLIIDDILRMVKTPIVNKIIGGSIDQRVANLEEEIASLSGETVAAMVDGFFSRIELLTRK